MATVPETVILYTDRNGRLPTFSTTSFKATSVIVTKASRPVGQQPSNPGRGRNQKEIWPQVIEKAFATLAGGYGAIANGGYPCTGDGGTHRSDRPPRTCRPPPSRSPRCRNCDGRQPDHHGYIIIQGLGYGLVSNHCYMFDKIVGNGASASVQLLNPWGIDQPAAISLTRLAQSGIVEIDIGRTS